MTEDDTFEALKRVPYRQALEYYYSTDITIRDDGMLGDTGWSFRELQEEYSRLREPDAKMK